MMILRPQEKAQYLFFLRNRKGSVLDPKIIK
jgi:hypothetical protein